MTDFLYFFTLNLLPGFLIFTLGFFALSKNPQETLNRLFFGLTFFIALSSVVGVFYRTAVNVPEAINWDLFYAAAFYLSIALFLHFCLVFYLRQALKFYLWLIIYLPVFAVATVERFSSLINKTFIRSFFGYYEAVGGPLDICRYLFLIAYLSAGIFFLYKSYRESTDRVTKKQAQMIIWAAILPAVIGSITDQLLPYFNIWYGSFVLFSFLFTSIFFFLAITRYRFAQITPELAIESIICCLPDPLLVTDTSGKITYCNNSAVNLFQKPLVNDNFSHFAQREELPALIRSLAAKGVDSRKVELNLHRVSGAVFPAEISLASIRGRGQAVIGLLWIVRDLSDDINLKNTLLKKKAEIEEKIAELERMNKFMANREARLEELRAEALALRYKQN